MIILHGRGSTAPTFASEFFESQDSRSRFLPHIFPCMKWVFPSSGALYAETEKEIMDQWFDMASVRDPGLREGVQIEGLRESVRRIREVVRREAEAVGGPGKVFLGGISQGGAAAVIALLAGGVQIGGFVGVCSWLPLYGHITSLARKDAASVVRGIREVLGLDDIVGDVTSGADVGSVMQTPVLLQHNADDEVVPVEHGEALRYALGEVGMSVEWCIYEDGGHWVNEPSGLDDMVEFIKKLM
ncbi:hypothetical protein ACN47E_005750 [Coniothyrium glycines]